MAEMLNDDPIFTTSVHYRDPVTALEFLEQAFGLEVTMAIEGPPDAPEMCHYEMALDGRGRIMVGAEFESTIRSPASLDGANTQRVHVLLAGDLDRHCERARAAGARIVTEPEDQFYGDRSYRALDLEGHAWTFSTHVRQVSRAGPRRRWADRSLHGDLVACAPVAGDDLRAAETVLARPSGELAAALEVTPATMSKHLRVLRRGNLVAERSDDDDARVRVYSLQAAAMADLREWMRRTEQGWVDQLAALRRHVEGDG